MAGLGVLLATTVSFFLAEIGDKSQIATAVIAAEYHPLWQVVGGTTSGMLLANVPAVWLGARFAKRLATEGRAHRRCGAVRRIGIVDFVTLG